MPTLIFLNSESISFSQLHYLTGMGVYSPNTNLVNNFWQHNLVLPQLKRKRKYVQKLYRTS